MDKVEQSKSSLIWALKPLVACSAGRNGARPALPSCAAAQSRGRCCSAGDPVGPAGGVALQADVQVVTCARPRAATTVLCS